MSRQQQIAADFAGWEATGLAVSGVVQCAEAVSSSPADLLVVRGDELVQGSVCDECGLLARTAHRCRSCMVPTYPVPDVIDEMIARMLNNHGKLDLTGTKHGVSLAARLHHHALAGATVQNQRR